MKSVTISPEVLTYPFCIVVASESFSQHIRNQHFNREQLTSHLTTSQPRHVPPRHLPPHHVPPHQLPPPKKSTPLHLLIARLSAQKFHRFALVINNSNEYLSIHLRIFSCILPYCDNFYRSIPSSSHFCYIYTKCQRN